jgi:lipoprotein-anchoring transpeptidase ErfK/SrfK
MNAAGKILMPVLLCSLAAHALSGSIWGQNTNRPMTPPSDGSEATFRFKTTHQGVPLPTASNTPQPAVTAQTPAGLAPLIITNSSARTNLPGLSASAEQILELQLALVRHGLSPGSLDGVLGSQTRAALRAFQQKHGLPTTGDLDESTRPQLAGSARSLTNYVVTTNDMAGLQPLGETWLAKSQQDHLSYETILELIAERSCSSPKLIRRLNPEMQWNTVLAGATIRVPQAELPSITAKAAFARISLLEKILQTFDESTNLLAHFPCSIAQRVEKRPVGELHVAVAIPNPNYTFDPEVFPESAEARELGRKLVLQPGPNNPVGTVWIGLDKPGYGIHGTPQPEQVGRTESHGCFRLANWNAEHLLKMVWVGMPVHVEP